jgi:spore germination cell wall hydrolase CwlJ-like protein
MLQPQASILPQQQSGVKEAIGMGTSIASLGDAGSKLYSKMTSKPGTDTAADTFKEGFGNFADKTKNFFGFGKPEAAGGRIGYALQGGIPYSQGTDPNKDPSRVGYMGMLDLQQPIDPTQAFNAQKAGQMPSVHQASNPLVQGAQAVNALNSGAKTLKSAGEFLGIGKTAPDMGSLANAPLPMARPEGLGAASEMGSLSSAPLPMARPEGLGALVSESASAAAAPALEAGAVEAAAAPVLGEMIGLGGAEALGAGAAAAGTEALAAGVGLEALGATAAGIGASVAEFLPLLFAFSDKRMKTDIKAIGKTFDGQTIHRYKYKGDPKTQIGLIAQEVEEAHPNAVGLAGGMKTVNYDTATREAAKRGHFAAGGSAQDLGINPEDPKYQQMEVSFDNLLQRYDNNPLLAAAAMDVGTKVVDAAIQKAQQTGGDITDFLPRRTQEYMFALSKAALGAHEAINRPARAAGGRTGYAFGSDVEERPLGLAPAPSDAMTMSDVAGGLSPEPTVQVAGEPPTADKPKHSPRDIDYMARTLMTEAGNQGDEGMAAVGHVIKNRYDKGNFGPDIASIVTAPKQFSPWNPDAVGTKNDPRLIDANSAAYKKASEMATGILGGSVANPLPEEHRGALNFANPNFSTAKWVPELVNSGNYAQIGAHVFGTSGAAPKGSLNPPSQAGEQKPVQVASLEPGLAGGRTFATVSGPSHPFVETIGKHLPNSVPTDSSFWVPLIAGLGTMLASDKYRFSQRLGEGLVGGAAAFAKMSEQEMGLKKSEQETEALRLANQMKPFLFTPYGNVVFLKDGRMMLQGDYDAAVRRGEKLETMAAPANAADAAAKFAQEQANKTRGPTTTPIPAPAPAPAPAPIKPSSIIETKELPPPSQEKLPEQKKVQPSYDDASKKLAEEERIVAVNGGAAATTAKNISDKYVAAVAPMATAARDSNRYLGELASNLAEATKGKGLDAPGFGYSGRAQFVGALNTMSRAFGGKGDFGEADKIDQINKKIEALQSSIAAAGGGQESYAALNMLRNAMAGPSMSPRAYSQLAADLMVTNQRAIDRDLHMSKYRADSNGLLSNAAQDFERTHDSAMYNNEAESIKKMILKAPDLIKDLRSGKYTSDQIDKVFETQGLRNMSRYFVGRS